MSRIRHQHYTPAASTSDAPDLFTVTLAGERGPPIAPRLPLARRYAAWRATALGADCFHQVARVALDQARAGTKRIEVNAIWASVRAARRVPMNNSWRSFVARELRATYPELTDRIEVRGAV